ncbi:hypothetical protein L204_100486 [Cryptococcus depauperatus]|nr:hypothetical protein L204_06382 [Cryptococcus depauperatus CBS 7855]
MPFPPVMPIGQQPLSIPSSSSGTHQGFGLHTAGNSFPRQASFGMQGGQGSMSKWESHPTIPSHVQSNTLESGSSGSSSGGMVSGLSALMRSKGNADSDMTSFLPNGGAQSSLSSNPHVGFHPASYGGGNFGFAAMALGSSAQGVAGSYLGSSNMGMSISPPHWGSLGSGSFVGSMGVFGTSLIKEREGRERELEARYVKDFSCCGKKLNGLHELLEHYEEEHANLAPNMRMAALNATQGNTPRNVSNPFIQTSCAPAAVVPPQLQAPQQPLPSDVPQPPGMMDIEMEDPSPYPQPVNMAQIQQQPQPYEIRTPALAGQSGSPWAVAFRPQMLPTQPQCVPPSLLSYAPPTPSHSGVPTPILSAPSPMILTPEQVAARAERKARKKAEKAARDEGSASETEAGLGQPGEKKFPCPIEGCDKVYKQANGLKYHLTRSINSGHGTIPPAQLAALVGEKGGEVDF